jgi:hypothetical protein
MAMQFDAPPSGTDPEMIEYPAFLFVGSGRSADLRHRNNLPNTLFTARGCCGWLTGAKERYSNGFSNLAGICCRIHSSASHSRANGSARP